MAHITPVSGDPAVNQPIVLRKGRNATIIFRFEDEDGNNFPIEDEFELRVKQNERSPDSILILDSEEGLDNVDGELHAIFTEENSNVDQYKCFFELLNITSGQTWFASQIFFNPGQPVEGTTTEITQPISIGEQVVNCTITIPGSGGSDLTSTDELPEGSTNLYYTNARADARVSNAIDTANTLDTLGKTIPGRDAVKAYIASALDDSGDVVGPASSVNNNVPTFSGLTGKVLQDSGKAFSIDGTFASNSDNKIPTEKAVKTYADALVTGLWDDRGTFDASGGAYPNSGGSGTAGAILKGDIWTISVAGTLPTGQVVEIGDTVRALVDTPGNTQANWAIGENNIGYVPVPNTRTVNGVDLSANRLIPSPNFIKRTGKMISAAITQEALTLQVLTANTLRAWPIDISVPTVLTTLHMEVTTGVGSTTCRMGLYSDNGSNYPGAKIADHEADGTIDTSSNGVKTKLLTGGVISAPGRYWQVENSNGAPTLRSIQRYAMSGAMGFAASLGTPTQPLGWTTPLSYAALPDTFPAGATAINVITPAIGWEEA